MSLPFTTTTCTIEDRDGSDDKWEQTNSYTTSGSQIPCVISLNDTNDSTTGPGQREATEATLFVNRDVSVSKNARVTDDVEGTVYLVAWVADRVALGLDRREAGLRYVSGV